MSLDGLAEVRQGYAPRSGARVESTERARVVFGRDVGADGSIEWDQLAPCPGDADIERFRIQAGDVLLTTRTFIPRAAIAVDPPANIVAGAQLAILRPKADALDAAYLAWFLNRADTRDALGRLSLGTSIRFLPISELREFPIPVPPLERQRAIGRAVELRRRENELLSHLNRARDLLLDAALRTPSLQIKS